MPITEFLERNAREFPNDVCLIEINPEIKEDRRVTWKEYELIEPSPKTSYRREITWSVFNEKANRFANLLIQRGIQKGDKVAILMMNGLEWLPIYFGILKTGALAVPLNFRYSADEIPEQSSRMTMFLCYYNYMRNRFWIYFFVSIIALSMLIPFLLMLLVTFVPQGNISSCL